jgi:hypothetical protein
MTDINDKPKRISGRDAGQYVQNLQLFHNSGTNYNHPKGATLWSAWKDDLYVVYSYGSHWPLYANWKGVWFANEARSTRTTNRHRGYANPSKPLVHLDLAGMRVLVDRGPVPEHLVMAAMLKLLPDALIPEATKIRIGGK